MGRADVGYGNMHLFVGGVLAVFKMSLLRHMILHPEFYIKDFTAFVLFLVIVITFVKTYRT